MALVPCPECGHRVSDGAQVCPECGATVVSLRRLLADAWRHGLSHAWKAAAAFPLLFVLIQFMRFEGDASAVFRLELLPWIGLIAVWGFVAGMTAIGIGALARRWLKGSRAQDVWAWSDAAVATLILFYGLWLYTIAQRGM